MIAQRKLEAVRSSKPSFHSAPTALTFAERFQAYSARRRHRALAVDRRDIAWRFFGRRFAACPEWGGDIIRAESGRLRVHLYRPLAGVTFERPLETVEAILDRKGVDWRLPPAPFLFGEAEPAVEPPLLDELEGDA